ncbi:MAG: (2Fe-2S)-binding protein [Rhodospirillales bacterium]|jgi:aerobic-type carbon monoxide dehydrogenase small subunit (CoxS/CutS family)
MTTTSLRVNGTSHDVEVDPATPLIFVLRNNLGLTGPKLGCGLETCGACAILVDGETELSCVRAVSEFEGCEITTVEGLTENGKLSVIQEAFVGKGAAQCGYCTPGIVIAATGLLAKTPQPNDAEIAEALEKHLCRCGSHMNVIKAIKQVVAEGGVSDI